MSRTTVAIAVLLLSLCLQPQTLADETSGEFGVVTATHAYIVDEDDEIVETLTTFATVDIVKDGDPWLYVRSGSDNEGWIRKEQLHRSSLFPYINEENNPAIRAALKTASEAELLAVDEKLPEAVTKMKAALKQLEDNFGRDNTGYAWLLTYMASMQLQQELTQDVGNTLKQAQTILNNLGESKSLHAADLFNTKAIVANSEGDHETAIANFQEALLISSSILGLDHSDIRIVSMNLADSYFQKGDLDVAITTQRRAQEIGVRILPPDVIERMTDSRNLGVYLLNAGKYHEAKAELLEAYRMLVVNEFSPLDTAADIQLFLAETYYQLGQNGVARRLLKEVEVALDADDLLPGKGETANPELNGRTANLQGLVEESAGRSEVALAHYERAFAIYKELGPSVDAAFVLKNAGDVTSKLERTQDAEKFYRQSLAMFSKVEGADSENVATLRDLLKNLPAGDKKMTQDAPSKSSSEKSDDDRVTHVMIASPEGYLLDTKDKVAETVPACTLLEVVAETDDSYQVLFRDGSYFVRREMVRVRRDIPSVGVMNFTDARPIFEVIAEGRRLMYDHEYLAAIDKFTEAEAAIEKSVGADNSFYVFTSCQKNVAAVLFGNIQQFDEGMTELAPKTIPLIESEHPVMFDVFAAFAARAFSQENNADAKAALVKLDELLTASNRKKSADGMIVETGFALVDLRDLNAQSAMARMERVVSIMDEIAPEESPESAESLALLGLTMFLSGAKDEANDIVINALERARKSRNGSSALNNVLSLNSAIALQRGELDRARKINRELLQRLINGKSLGDLKKRAKATMELASIAASQDDFNDATKLAELTVANLTVGQGLPGIDKTIFLEGLIQAHELLAFSYEKLGNAAKSAEYKAALPPLKAALEKMLNDAKPANTPPSDAPASDDDDISDYEYNKFNLWPPSEFMLIATQETAIRESENGPVIFGVKAGTKLWSLESSNGWSRVKVPGGADEFGWISHEHVADLSVVQLQNMLPEIEERNSNNPNAEAEAEAVMAKFQNSLEMGQQGDVANSVKGFEEALEGSRKLLGENNPLVAMVSVELVNAYMNQKQFSRARTLLEDVEPITRATLGENHPRVAQNAVRLASLLSVLGDHRGAKRQLESAILVAAESFGMDDPRTTMLRVELAPTLIQLGQLDIAESDLNYAIERLTEDYDGPDAVLASAHASLGSLAAQRDEEDQAAEHFESAANEYTKLGEGFIGYRGRVLYQLGITLIRTGELNEAEQLLNQANEDLASSGSTDPELQVRMDQIKGLNAFLSGDLDTAERLTNDALKTIVQIYGPDHLATTELQQTLATILVAKNEMTEAYGEFDAVRQTVFEYVQKTLADLPVREQAAFLRVQDKRQLDRALSIAFRPGANAIDGDFSATWALNARNLPHELSARSGQIRRLLTQPAEKDAYDQFLAARQRLATIPVGADDPAEQQFRSEEIASQNEIVAKSLTALPEEVRQQIELQNGEWIEIGKLRKSLAADETLIEIVRMRPLSLSREKMIEEANPKFQPAEEYVAWIVPPHDAGDIKVVRLGDAERIDELVLQVFSELQRSFLRIGQDGHRKSTEAAMDSCKSLSDVIWKPIQQHLASRVKVILSPDGELWRAPWSTLPTGDNRLLLDDFEVRLVVTGRELMQTSKNSLPLSAPLIIADPDYDASSNTIRDALKNVPLNVPRPPELDDDRTEAYQRATLSHRALRLPGTAREARDVAGDVKQMAAQDPRICLQALASEEVFRRSRRPYSVMFSTHGFFLPLTASPTEDSENVVKQFGSAADPLLRCGLLLAGCNLKDRTDSMSDGILLGREIVETDLRGTKLVVLSACETGLGDIADGEGIAGMRQAFQLAGAESVVSTLWSIDDAETARLMKEFYVQLSAGKSKSAALRQAQLTRIAALRERHSAAHPFYWAAFTLTGDK